MARTSRTDRSTELLPVWLRRSRVEILLWAFREGRRLDGDALTAILGAKHARADEPFTQWTRHTVRELLWCEVGEWCAPRGLATPQAVAVTTWAVLDYLAATDSFGPGSDPLALLRVPLVDSGGLRIDGRPRSPRRGSHPSTHRVG